MQARGLSLWLVPDDPEREDLRVLVERLSVAHASPLFEPHVTLLGQLTLPEEEVLAAAGELARTTPPLAVVLGTHGFESGWTRWLFRHVEPCDSLMRLRRRAESLLGGGKPYRPHLSLMYGEYDDELRRSVMGDVPSVPLALVLGQLWVVSTEGPVRAWAPLSRFALQPRP